MGEQHNFMQDFRILGIQVKLQRDADGVHVQCLLHFHARLSHIGNSGQIIARCYHSVHRSIIFFAMRKLSRGAAKMDKNNKDRGCIQYLDGICRHRKPD